MNNHGIPSEPREAKSREILHVAEKFQSVRCIQYSAYPDDSGVDLMRSKELHMMIAPSPCIQIAISEDMDHDQLKRVLNELTDFVKEDFYKSGTDFVMSGDGPF